MVLSSKVPSMSWTSEGLAATIASAMADYRAEVGARLRQLREAKDLSQEDAAHEVGVAAKTFLRWENGRAWPTPDNWKAITGYFGVDPREGIPSPGPLGLGTRNKPNGNGNGDDVTLKDIKAQLDEIQRATATRYAALEAVMQSLVAGWQQDAGQPAPPVTVEASMAFLKWLRGASAGIAPRSEGGEGRRAANG